MTGRLSLVLGAFVAAFALFFLLSPAKADDKKKTCEMCVAVKEVFEAARCEKCKEAPKQCAKCAEHMKSVAAPCKDCKPECKGCAEALKDAKCHFCAAKKLIASHTFCCAKCTEKRHWLDSVHCSTKDCPGAAKK